MGRKRVRIKHVLYQKDYAGLDYEDGGQDAAVQCGDDCGGLYITQICSGSPRFDSGKFHNHCTQCPGFGECLGDYREAHCDNCGGHWFSGMSGFPCDHCGGKKLVPMKAAAPEAWDQGFAGLERLRGGGGAARQQSLMQRMMMAMFAGALSAGDEDAAPDAAGLDRQRQLLMTTMQGIMQAGVGDMFGDDEDEEETSVKQQQHQEEEEEEEAKPTKAVSESSSFVASEGAFSPGSSSSSSSSSSSGSSPAQTRAASATASKRRSSRVRQVNN